MNPKELLERYIILHNYGVESGDFEPLFTLFADDIVFEFEDPRIGRFDGIADLRGVFRRQAPSLAISVGEIIEEGLSARADYADEASPGKRLGGLLIETQGEKIKRVYISR